MIAPLEELKRFVRRWGRRVKHIGDERWWNSLRPPWRRQTRRARHAAVWCNICGWSGESFGGTAHSESAVCPRCESIARDRFLFWCFTTRAPRRRGLRVLETSPRLVHDYRTMMGNWYAYRCSDFDFNGHRGDLALDLQNIDLPNATVDVLLTPHVLEHVPDTEKALSEVHRILAPDGRVYLQVPLLQGVTAPPVTEEYHADNTLVHWRFGWDLTDVLRRTGFAVRVLVPGAFKTILEEGGESLGEGGGGFDPASIRAAAVTTDLDAVLTPSEARHLGIEPPYQYVVWECERRAGPT